MSTDQQNAVTVTDQDEFEIALTDRDIAKLYKGLHALNVSIESLSNASILNKGAAADKTLNAARDLLANQNFTIHKLFNDLTRIAARVEKIESIGIIKNG